jgi:hypothetical protein
MGSLIIGLVLIAIFFCLVLFVKSGYSNKDRENGKD